MKIFRIALILYSILFFILLGLFLVFVAPEYFACAKCKYEGEQGKTIWGDKIDCYGENKALGQAIFHDGVFMLIISAIALIIGCLYYCFLVLHQTIKLNNRK